MIKWNPLNRKKKHPVFMVKFTDDENDHLANCRECQKGKSRWEYDAEKLGVKTWTSDELVDIIRKHTSESLNDDGTDEN